MAHRSGHVTTPIGAFEIAEGAIESEFDLATVEMPAEIKSEAAPTTGSLRGIVFEGAETDSPDGASVVGDARVTVEGTGMRTIADETGRFLLWSLTPGDYRLRIEKEGYEPRTIEVKVAERPPPAALSEELWVGLMRRAAASADRGIAGSLELYHPDGSPSNRFDLLTVRLIERPDRAATIAPDGTFAFEGLTPGTYSVLAAGEAFMPIDPLRVDLSERTNASVRVTMVHAQERTPEVGSIVGTALRALAGVEDMSGITVALAGTSMVALTDRQGRFRFRGVEPGVYEVLAQVAGFATASFEGVEVAAGGEIALDPLLLEPIFDYPMVIDADPAPGSRDVMVRREIPVFVRFSKKMRPESLKRAVSIEPAVEFQIFAGRERAETDFDLMLILIDGVSKTAPIGFDREYRVTIAEGALDYEGLAMQESARFAFRTGKAAVMQTQPADGARDAQVRPLDPVIVEFNAAIDPRSFDPRQVQIRPSLGVVPTMNLIDDSRTGWSSIQINATWAQDTEYAIALGRRLRTTGGQTLANTPYTFRFKTVKLVDAPHGAILPRRTPPPED
jgi:hypothetical protein